MSMTQEQKARWDEANRMEAEHPSNPLVLENVIRIRSEIAIQLEAKWLSEEEAYTSSCEWDWWR